MCRIRQAVRRAMKAARSGKGETMDEIRILVVDDEARMRKLVCDFLAKRGYTTVEEAIEDYRTLQTIVETLANTQAENGQYLSTVYPNLYGGINDYLQQISPVMEQMIAAQNDINEATAANVVLQSDVWQKWCR